MTRAEVSRTTAGSAQTPAPPHVDPAPSPSVTPHARAETVPATTDTSTRRRYALVLLLAVIVGIAVRAVFVIGDWVSSPDEAAYLTTGLNFWAGDGFTTLSGAPALHFPPGVPILFGAIHEVVGGDPHRAAAIATILTSVLTILPLAGIARLAAGRRAAVITAWIAALCPALTVMPLASGGSAGPFTLVVATALWVALRSRTLSGRRLIGAAALCGALVGLAYLVRPEGLFYSVVLVPVLVLPGLGGFRGLRRAGVPAWRGAVLVAGAFCIALALLVAPYVQYLHSESGRWQLTAKAEGVSMKAWRAVATENRPAAQALLYKPDDTGYTFPAERRSVTDLIRDDPGGYLGIVSTNLNRLYSTLFNAPLIPYPHWALLPGMVLLLAIFAAWRRRHDRVVLAVLAAMAVPVVSAIGFLMQARYLVPTAALACVLVAIGLLQLPKRWFRAAVAATIVLVVLSTAANLYSPENGWFHPDHGFAEHRLVGEWIGENSQPDDLIMSTTTIPGFHAQRVTVPTPYATQERIIDFARHYGVRYLIVDQANGTRFRPQLRSLAFDNGWKTLRAVYRHREDGRRTVVYEIVPRPPRFEGRVPVLGYVGEKG